MITYHKLFEGFFEKFVVDANSAWMLDGRQWVLDDWQGRDMSAQPIRIRGKSSALQSSSGESS